MIDKESLELYNLIKDFQKYLKKEKNSLRIQEVENQIIELKEIWENINECKYPFIIKNNKLVDIKTLIKEEEILKKKNKTFSSPDLNSIINRTSKETELINSLYDKNFNSDIPDPYRKRKKRQ